MALKRRICDVSYIAHEGDPDRSLRDSTPADVYRALRAAKTVGQMSRILSRAEKRIANLSPRGSPGDPIERDYLDCDEVQVLLGWALEIHHIPFESVIGNSDEGSSHVWTRVDGRNVDPTHQGFGNGKFTVIEVYDPLRGVVQIPSDEGLVMRE